MWNFIKYTFVGLLVIVAAATLIVLPQLGGLLLILMIPYWIGKLYSNRKRIELPSMDENTKEKLKKTGKRAVETAGKVASMTSQKVVVPFLRMMLNKLEAKEKYQSASEADEAERAKDDLKNSFKKRESEL